MLADDHAKGSVMSNALWLFAAIARYGHTKALESKQDQPTEYDLDLVEIDPILSTIRPFGISRPSGTT